MMNIQMFNRKYTVRRFTEAVYYQGYAQTEHSDFTVSIHVHPSGINQEASDAEGLRKIIRLDGHGMTELLTADQKTGQKADLLKYGDDWYECVNCQYYSDTLLNHYNYSFILVPDDAGGTMDLQVRG